MTYLFTMWRDKDYPKLRTTPDIHAIFSELYQCTDFQFNYEFWHFLVIKYKPLPHKEVSWKSCSSGDKLRLCKFWKLPKLPITNVIFKTIVNCGSLSCIKLLMDLTIFWIMKTWSIGAQYDPITRVLSSLATWLHSNQPAVFSQQPMWPLPLQFSFASQLICLFSIFPSFLGAPASECIGPTGASPAEFDVLALMLDVLCNWIQSKHQKLPIFSTWIHFQETMHGNHPHLIQNSAKREFKASEPLLSGNCVPLHRCKKVKKSTAFI